MARIRTIKPETPQSESLGRVSRDARLTFLLLWTIVDDDGRTRAASRLLASLLFPYDEDAPSLIDGWLEELEAEGSILRYTVDEATYLEVCNWQKHQRIDKPTRSKLPAPREHSRTLANTREESATDLDLDLDLDLDRGHGARAQPREETRQSDDPPPQPPPMREISGGRMPAPLWRPPGNPHHRPDGLVNGAAVRRHGSHAWCSLPREGLCVPAFLHEEFLGKSAKPSDDLRAWYRATVARFDGVAVGDDALRFWRNEFAGWVGTVTAAPHADTKEGRTLAAASRTLAAIGRGEL